MVATVDTDILVTGERREHAVELLLEVLPQSAGHNITNIANANLRLGLAAVLDEGEGHVAHVPCADAVAQPEQSSQDCHLTAAERDGAKRGPGREAAAGKGTGVAAAAASKPLESRSCGKIVISYDMKYYMYSNRIRLS